MLGWGAVLSAEGARLEAPEAPRGGVVQSKTLGAYRDTYITRVPWRIVVTGNKRFITYLRGTAHGWQC